MKIKIWLQKKIRYQKLLLNWFLITFSNLFDRKWYLTKNPDVEQARCDPVWHYLNHGGFEGRDPGPHFSSSGYLNTYEDVKGSGINPLVHYLSFGRREGRESKPQIYLTEKNSVPSSPILDLTEEKTNMLLIQSSGFFEEASYLKDYPHVRQINMPPLLHYLRYGGVAGLDLAPHFYSKWYLDTYEDVKNSGMNPLVHYLKYGREQGYKAHPPIYKLSKMYDYSRENNKLAFWDVPESIYLKGSRVVGSFKSILEQGEALCPPAYVSVIENAVVFGGSSLVLVQQQYILSDEMVDFAGEEFGVKPLFVKPFHGNMVMVEYKEEPTLQIKEGILLSCDHDNNYFHWLLECLPKLELINSLEQFKGVPILILKGLHKNLEAALKLVNINDHPLIYLEPKVAYQVERLVFPSALSRVVDRYLGYPVFNIDIVLSHKWIYKVSEHLKRGAQSDQKPWRKLFLTRKKGLRAVANLEQLELILLEQGFEIIDLNEVSLDFQIKLFSQASVIVAPSGAALTNMLLCQSETKVVILMSNHESTNYFFWSNLGAIMKLDVTIIAGERLFNLTNYWSVHDDYVIDPQILFEEIKKDLTNQNKKIALESNLSEGAFPSVDMSLNEYNSMNIFEKKDDKRLSFIKVLPGEKIRLVFLIILPELWPSLEPVWMSAKQDNRFFTMVVVLKNEAHPDTALTSQLKARALLESKSIPYFTEQVFSIESHRPHVIFYPSPYEIFYSQQYKPEYVSRMGIRIAYVPYGLEVGGGMFNARYQYDSEVPRNAWRIFARSQSQLASFGRHCSRGNGHVVVTGHPRSESVDSSTIPAHRVVKSKAMSRKVILWTPHFSVASRRKWSSFLDHHETILKLIDNRPDLFLLVRPHPFLQTTLAKLSDWGWERVTTWFKTINERGNVHVDIGTDYRSAFVVSSALMTDAGSFMVEYLRAGKPICHLTSRDDIGLTEEVRNLTCFYPGATESDIASFLDRVQSGSDPLSDARQEALQIYFGSGNQKPSQVILNEIANNINDLQHTSHIMPSSHHEEAFQYWVKATTTFLAPETYYQEQEKKLRDILERHAHGRFAADIGCGNGRFTELFSNYFEFIEAADPNEQLISEARENAALKGISNIAYTVERLEHAESLSSYDFLSCMGVTSGLIDDDVFLKSIWKLKAAMRPGSKLLMKDSLSLSTPEFIEWNGYKAVYRNISAYLAAFEAAGLSLVEEQIITEDGEKNHTNRLFVFEAAI